MHIQLKYPYEWAKTVVDHYHEVHARATETVVKLTGVSIEEVAWLLAKGSPSWEGFKSCCMVAEKYQKKQESLGIEVHGSALENAVVAHLERTGLLNRRIVLTRLRKNAENKEHSLKGGVEEAKATETPHQKEISIDSVGYSDFQT